MKKLMFGLLAIVGFTTLISWKGWDNIQGSGNLKKETREVGNFSGIESRGSMNVVITYGSSNQITLKGDESLAVPGENPLVFCNPPNSYILEITNVDLDPNPPEA